VDDEEEEEGMSCVGAPIRDHRGRVIAALSLTGLSPSFAPRRIESLIEMIKGAATRISANLGYTAGGSQRIP
jgi:IclR family acetate operon transcriptional repressor